MFKEFTDEKFLENVTELYMADSNTVIAVSRNGRTFKISAHEVIRGGGRKYTARYQEKFDVEMNVRNPQDHYEHKKRHLGLWADVEMAQQSSDDIEVCLKMALHWVNERCAGPQTP